MTQRIEATADDPITAALRRVVREELAALSALSPAPSNESARLLDKAAIAAVLAVSPAQVDRFDRQGQPHIRVGDVKRYRSADVVRWHEERGRER